MANVYKITKNNIELEEHGRPNGDGKWETTYDILIFKRIEHKSKDQAHKLLEGWIGRRITKDMFDVVINEDEEDEE